MEDARKKELVIFRCICMYRASPRSLKRVPLPPPALGRRTGEVMPNPSHCIVLCALGQRLASLFPRIGHSPHAYLAREGPFRQSKFQKGKYSDGHGLWPDLCPRTRCSKTADPLFSAAILRRRVPWQNDMRNRVRQQNNIMALLYESFVHHRH